MIEEVKGFIERAKITPAHLQLLLLFAKIHTYDQCLMMMRYFLRSMTKMRERAATFQRRNLALYQNRKIWRSSLKESTSQREGNSSRFSR